MSESNFQTITNRAKIIGELSRNLKKQCMYMEDIFLTYDLFSFLSKFFSKIRVAKLGARLICKCGLYAGVYSIWTGPQQVLQGIQTLTFFTSRLNCLSCTRYMQKKKIQIHLRSKFQFFLAHTKMLFAKVQPVWQFEDKRTKYAWIPN